ncbi:hypothetical protein B1A87_002755 [Arthrobacter sp. KBS0703]|uniref:hypothetical protein n=1 Tax=Arthrobacter sp. KBS0703 TaxID=1955698 RepID=UPI00098E997A|nr:hypothetical protein [Arthrobacter sp. KBS0703]TSE14997.1 hypothetical protein B1A87_002755 [Arthrobacter sp. KBS0703]
MTAMMNDLIGDSFADRPATEAFLVEACAPVLTITVNSQAVITIARRLHDDTCLDGPGCELRDLHALDTYEADVHSMLAALVQAATDGDNPDISSCRGATDRRWFKGQWWCNRCKAAVVFRAGSGWVHIIGDFLE